MNGARHFVPEYLRVKARVDNGYAYDFYRAVEFEGQVAKAMGKAVANDSNLAYCDDCSDEILQIVQAADGSVLCRRCAQLR